MFWMLILPCFLISSDGTVILGSGLLENPDKNVAMITIPWKVLHPSSV